MSENVKDIALLSPDDEKQAYQASTVLETALPPHQADDVLYDGVKRHMEQRQMQVRYSLAHG